MTVEEAARRIRDKRTLVASAGLSLAAADAVGATHADPPGRPIYADIAFATDLATTGAADAVRAVVAEVAYGAASGIPGGSHAR